MVEKRIFPRKRVLKAGTIAFGGAAINCTVRNLTASGALLEVESPLGIPRQFVLDIAADHFLRECSPQLQNSSGRNVFRSLWPSI